MQKDVKGEGCPFPNREYWVSYPVQTLSRSCSRFEDTTLQSHISSPAGPRLQLHITVDGDQVANGGVEHNTETHTGTAPCWIHPKLNTWPIACMLGTVSQFPVGCQPGWLCSVKQLVPYLSTEF